MLRTWMHDLSPLTKLQDRVACVRCSGIRSSRDVSESGAIRQHKLVFLSLCFFCSPFSPTFLFVPFRYKPDFIQDFRYGLALVPHI